MWQKHFQHIKNSNLLLQFAFLSFLLFCILFVIIFIISCVQADCSVMCMGVYGCMQYLLVIFFMCKLVLAHTLHHTICMFVHLWVSVCLYQEIVMKRTSQKLHHYNYLPFKMIRGHFVGIAYMHNIPSMIF